MNKLRFMNEVGDLADKFALLLYNYTNIHDGYNGETENKEPIIVGNIGVSIQNGVLSVINVDIGSVDSKHRIIINKHPSSVDSEWRTEDK